ncbi:MAG: SurA N-terminal domain-containing protein, partial [Prolixibacteraceae bacterium]|nr:SurA N-terminal domain-containing protein [Prolixibacteraceae bacterium]
MATLQNIRNRAGIIVAIVIGLAMVGFVLGDMFQSGNTLFQRQKSIIGEIDGKSFQYLDFQTKVQDLGEIYKLNNGNNQLDENTWVQLREQVWQNIVREALMKDTYDDLGINVSTDELYDMVQGSNIHPIVQQIFTNPNTQQVDRNAIIRFLKSLETSATPESRAYWLYLEQQISETRAQSKYNTLVKKGLYVTNEEAQISLSQKNHNVNFSYIALPYTSVSDSQVVVTEKDLKDYYNNHQEDYKQEGSRKIEYVVFPVRPTDVDRLDTENQLAGLRDEFKAATDDAQFVDTNSDENFDDSWFSLDELPTNIKYWIETQKAEVGDVFGPYFINDVSQLAKYHATEIRPDSVEARHILIRVDGTETQDAIQKKIALADSLKTAVEKGSNFADLA